MKRFFAFLSIFILLFGFVLVNAAEVYKYDDRNSMFEYSARTAVQSSAAFDYTGSRIGSSGTVTFSFFGDYLAIHSLKAPYGSKVRVYIDGTLKGTYETVAHTANSYVANLLVTYSDLGKQQHDVSIICLSTQYPNYQGTTSSPYFYLDYIEVDFQQDIDPVSTYLIVFLVSFWIFAFFQIFTAIFWRLDRK